MSPPTSSDVQLVRCGLHAVIGQSANRKRLGIRRIRVRASPKPEKAVCNNFWVRPMAGRVLAMTRHFKNIKDSFEKGASIHLLQYPAHERFPSLCKKSFPFDK